MDDYKLDFPMHVGVVVTSAVQLASVYALLGGVALAAVAAAAPAAPKGENYAKSTEVEAEVEEAGAGTDVTGEIDAHGHPWSADLHASTKGKTKDGLWRMKVGVSRPDALPGFPAAATGTAESGAASEAGASATTGAAESPAGDDDEFAAFRAAAAASDATDAAAKAGVAPRKWTDADLGSLCNQAATKLGDPAPVKALIGEYVPEGQVAHSRNIPEETREAFAKAVEAKAGIEFAG